jgi:hypothetical protein
LALVEVSLDDIRLQLGEGTERGHLYLILVPDPCIPTPDPLLCFRWPHVTHILKKNFPAQFSVVLSWPLSEHLLGHWHLLAHRLLLGDALYRCPGSSAPVPASSGQGSCSHGGFHASQSGTLVSSDCTAIWELQTEEANTCKE